jgi:hypothetical protein
MDLRRARARLLGVIIVRIVVLASDGFLVRGTR